MTSAFLLELERANAHLVACHCTLSGTMSAGWCFGGAKERGRASGGRWSSYHRLMSEFKFHCPACGQRIQCEEQWSGQHIQCPACQGDVVVPQTESAAGLKIQSHQTPVVAEPARPPLRSLPASSPTSPRSARTRLIVTAVVCVGLVLLLGVLIYRPMSKAKARGQEYVCTARLKEIGLALRLYSSIAQPNVQDEQSRFPFATNWCDAILPNLTAGMYSRTAEQNFQCRGADPSQRCHYALNAKLGGLLWFKVNPNTVVLFETAGGWNVSGGSELMLSRSRHGGLFLILFADGRAGKLTESQLKTLRWEP